MDSLVENILEQEAIVSLLKDSEKAYLLDQLGFPDTAALNTKEVLRLVFFLSHSVFSENDNVSDDVSATAYYLLNSISIYEDDVVSDFENVFGYKGIHPVHLYYFYLSLIALKAEKSINIRIDLKEFKPAEVEIENWKHRLLNKSIEAFLLLIRKANGFADIKNALSIIEQLKTEQASFEATYLQDFSTKNEMSEAYVLLSIYHLSKAVVETAQYLLNGYDYKERIEVIIRRHVDIAKKTAQKEARLVGIYQLFEFGLNTIQKNAIWSQTKFNDKIRQLCKNKAQAGIIELLPSQRKALNKNLLDVAANVTVLQMPTSAGKTLLAEFNILVTKALRADAKIVYIVPSRALVNQVYFDLKSDLEPLDFSIEKTSSAIEVDPAEDAFLSGEERIDILISTPEKLDLLIRRRHPSVEDVSMFILDEAHTIQNGERGARLELLLAILKREKPEAKYMLLSPFLRNAGNTLTEWLGGGNSIAIDWKPSEKLILGLDTHITPKRIKNEIHLEVLPSPYNSIKPIGKTTIPNPYEIKSSGEKKKILEFSIKHFTEKEKTQLVLCYGKGTANNRANFIYDKVDAIQPSDDLRLIKKFIEEEIGKSTTLSKVLEKGIATHHAGMTDESRLLVEHLIREKQIQYVCATTTIAEGVNFPVSTVFFDDFRRGRNNHLSSNDFWNIAGRAGRTMVDNYGKIILPFNSQTNRDAAENIIKEGANELSSVLSELFENADIIERRLSETDGFNTLFKDFSSSLSPLIQYYVHLLTVGENEYFISEIEDLFKDSLEYYLLETVEKKEKFISICRSIYLHLQAKYQDKGGALNFANKTGFSVPSVLKAMAESAKSNRMQDINSWSKEQLFNSENTSNLAEKISVIAQLRETALGVDDSKTPFNPELYAQIVTKWVKGDNLSNLSNIHPSFTSRGQDEAEAEKRLTKFISKMKDVSFKTSWGLSALEGIVKGDDDIKDSFIPSLVYFGVDNEKSLALRMVGVPRNLSFTLKNALDNDLKQYSFQKLRKMIREFKNSDWDSLKPSNSTLDGMEWKRITEILVK